MAQRPYHHGDLRTALVDVATTLAAERGPAGLSMAEASRRAGVSVAAPYRHFRDRDQLLAAVVARAYDQLAADLRTAAQGPPREALAAAAGAYVRLLGDPVRYDLLFASGLDKREHPEVLRAAVGVLEVLLEPARAVSDGEPAAVALATAVGVLAHGYATLHRDGGLGDTAEVEAQAGRAVRALLRGRTELLATA